MNEVVLLSGVRTPIAKFLGGLKNIPAPELGGMVIKEAIKRAGLAPGQVDEVIVGQTMTAGCRQSPAYQAVVNAGLPAKTKFLHVIKACPTSLQCVISGAQSIQLGENNVVIASGQENMSRYPFIKTELRSGDRLSEEEHIDSMLFDGYLDPFTGEHQGTQTEILIKKHNISRREQDEYAYESYRKAIAAMDAGIFADEILPIETKDGMVDTDETPRRDTTIEKLSQLRAVFPGCDTITAGNASKVNDAASAVALANRDYADENGLAYDFKIDGYSTFNCESKLFGIAPVGAVKQLCAKLGINVSDFDLIELNEAFAAQAIAVIRELELDPAKVNVYGGAVALGHPIGATGARLVVTLMNAMKRKNAKRGLATICGAGGIGVAISISKIN